MPKLGKKFLTLVIILIIFMIISLVLAYGNKKPLTNIDLTKIPLNVNGWQGKEIPIEENVSAILETDSILMREYKKGDDKIWLAIVYYKDSRVALHLPESCLSGQGSKLAEIGEEQIEDASKDKFFATKLITTSDYGDQLLLYYFKTGNMSTNSSKNMRLAMMLSNIRGYHKGGALVRFSMPVNNANRVSNLRILKNFIINIDPILSKFLI